MVFPHQAEVVFPLCQGLGKGGFLQHLDFQGAVLLAQSLLNPLGQVQSQAVLLLHNQGEGRIGILGQSGVGVGRKHHILPLVHRIRQQPSLVQIARWEWKRRFEWFGR